MLPACVSPPLPGPRDFGFQKEGLVLASDRVTDLSWFVWALPVLALKVPSPGRALSPRPSWVGQLSLGQAWYVSSVAELFPPSVPSLMAQGPSRESHS